jgi:hypothetical protein
VYHSTFLNDVVLFNVLDFFIIQNVIHALFLNTILCLTSENSQKKACECCMITKGLDIFVLAMRQCV